MKRKMKFWMKWTSVCFGLIMLLSLQTKAQSTGGESSIGPRFGGSSGISFKHHSQSNKSAIEAIAGWNFDNHVDGFAINLLFEKLAPLSGNRLAAIIGVGPAFAFGDDFRFGGAGIIGLDWRVSNIINLQLDWQPTWYFVNGSDFTASNVGFTIRYVLNHKRNKK